MLLQMLLQMFTDLCSMHEKTFKCRLMCNLMIAGVQSLLMCIKVSVSIFLVELICMFL